MGPERTVPVLQNTLKLYDITDPVDGTLFPKVLPTEAFPDKPDPYIVNWYDQISKYLMRHAEVSEGMMSNGDTLMSNTDYADDCNFSSNLF
jgi:hypothetical protein